MIIDTHCHLNDKKFENAQNIINNFDQDNVLYAITNSAGPQDLQQVIQLSTNKNVYCTLGIHPHDADKFDKNIKQFIIDNAQKDKVVAIGEIGLDYYYDFCDRVLQKQVMIQQIELAYSLKLPMVFHIREAMGDFIKYVREHKNMFQYGAEIHSFSGSVEIAQELIGYGFYLGFNGIITFKNANKTLEVIKNIPLDRILVETDAPYLTPEPYRGRINEPKYTNLVVAKIAELKNIDTTIVETIVNNNAYTLFKKLRKQ